MIHNDITIMFAHEGVTYSLMVNGGSDNLPYDLATAFSEVVEKTCANPEIVIREMKDVLLAEYGEGEEEEG